MSYPTSIERRIGLLVPASNSNAETLTHSVLDSVPGVDAYATRFRLPGSLDTRIDNLLLGPSLGLLTEVNPDVVAFHGTSGSWTGIAQDAELAAELSGYAGVPATTATQAMVSAIHALDVSRISLCFPGTSAIATQIAAQLALIGVEVVASSTLPKDLSNPEIAAMTRDQTAALVDAAIVADVDAVLCVGTNLRSGYLVAELEERHQVTIIDSALAVVWHCLRLIGSPARVTDWGRLLADH